MYLDTDVILAELKDDDWLASAVDHTVLDSPVTSTATVLEVQYAMQDEWDRDRLATAHEAIGEAGIRLVDLREDHLDEIRTFRVRYDRVNVFDAVHLGTAYVEGVPIVSTDTLYPDVEEVDHVDPRDLE